MNLTKLNTMDEISISLPCGFSAKYKDIFYNNDKFPCPVCKIHDLTSQECLNMTKNKIFLNEIKLDQKKNQYEELMKEFENNKYDPKYYIDESFDCLKREVDVRREEIKLMLNKVIDDYHDGLLEKIDMERDFKLKVIEKRIQNTDTFDSAIFKIDDNLDIHSKLEFYKKSEIKIDDGIRSVTNIIDDMKNLKFKLTESCVNIDIKKLFGELTWKEENKTLQKCKKINEMDDVNIILPCGLSAKFKDIFYNYGKFPCPACKAHDLTSQECLNMIRNRLVLSEKSFELDKNQYKELMIEFENYKNEPKHFINECYESLKRKVYLRKEEIKVLLCKNINIYQHGLLKKIDTERDLKLKELEERIQKITKLDLAILDVDKNLDVHSQLDFHKNNKLKIRNAIKSVQNILDDFKEPKFKLVNRNVDIDFKKSFGELYPVEETIIILSEDEFNDESRAEATIQLIINNLSQLKYRNNFRIRSKKCFVRNFEWHIWIEINEENGETGFYLARSSMEESNEFSVNVTAVLSLVNKSDPNQSLNKTLTHVFTKNDSWGYLLATMDEIMNPASGYYDANDDSITLKAVIKAELPQKNS
ncbi:ubiquitin carboxyl-terminal hydrolase 7 [Brachionus plicatilis]|uniref:Ubiquitin carboxyl-terminal hydrolase 7 n=1 Tax=Brachionus plicatilis TaxID=10195 RepID=A0A3M7RGF0_BRAPC|nr:ubiquitin carboxyl-terminal hydrolase 7 [Brachionus plicatilis]